MAVVSERKDKVHWVEWRENPILSWHQRAGGKYIIACGGKPTTTYKMPGLMITCEQCKVAFERRGSK